MYAIGLDAGAVLTKAVLLKDQKPLSYEIVPSKGDFRKASCAVISSITAKISSDDPIHVFATGCGAEMVTGCRARLNDISCQARGINLLFPSVRTIIEIGGRSTKIIRISPKGRVINFAVGERCAASSGKFLQSISRIIGIGIEEIGEISLRSRKKIDFTTGCAVFAETEVISRIAEGSSVEDILAGIHAIMANKVMTLLRGTGRERDFAITGGGARDLGLIKAIEEQLDIEAYVPEEPLTTAAMGAALIGEG